MTHRLIAKYPLTLWALQAGGLIGLFVGLLVVLAVWVGFLLTLYFKTVYPHRNHTPTTIPFAQ